MMSTLNRALGAEAGILLTCALLGLSASCGAGSAPGHAYSEAQEPMGGAASAGPSTSDYEASASPAMDAPQSKSAVQSDAPAEPSMPSPPMEASLDLASDDEASEAAAPAAEDKAKKDAKEEATADVAQDRRPQEAIAPAKPPACTAAQLEPEEIFLSADDSNSQASAAVAAALIRQGRYVPAWTVRTYEFLNYYDLGYASGDELRVVPQLRPVPGRQQAWTLQLGVVAPRMDPQQRRPLNLTFVLDTSGSMAGRGMESVRHVVGAIAGNLRQGDVVSIVTFDVTHRVVLSGHEAKGPNDAAIIDQVARLTPNNRTDLASAIDHAYRIAAEHQRADRLNRIVLISDGNTNTGAQSLETIAARANQVEDSAIFLVGVAVGEAHGLNYLLMDRFTDAGKGAFVYVDSKDEADRLFGEHFLANMEVAAKDVRVKLVLPPGFDIEKFHGEQMSHVASEVEPQHLAPNDAMVYHQVIASCLDPESEARFVVEAEYTDPRTNERRVATAEATLGTMLKDASPQLVKGDALVAYAEGLKEVDALTFSDGDQALARCREVHAEVAAAATDTGDRELASVEKLLRGYCGTIENGEVINGVCDCSGEPTVAAALGLCESERVVDANLQPATRNAGTIAVIPRLREGGPTMAPREGCHMLAVSSGPVGEPDPVNTPTFGGASDPQPEFNGPNRFPGPDGASINDLSTVTLTLTAPEWANSFSFDFVYLSAEFPSYVGSTFNDTFYATIKAASTNEGKPTNISFDGNGRSIEINNNYFQNAFHPCWERGTGFDRPQAGGSTCWLQTSWPVRGGERFTLTFSVHDEGDGIYSSEALIDNFRWHAHQAVGATDPVN